MAVLIGKTLKDWADLKSMFVDCNRDYYPNEVYENLFTFLVDDTEPYINVDPIGLTCIIQVLEFNTEEEYKLMLTLGDAAGNGYYLGKNDVELTLYYI